MFSEEEKEISRLFKIPVPQPYPFELKYKRSIINAYQYKHKEKSRAIFRRKFATALASFLLIVSSIAVAVNFQKIKIYFRGLGNGVDTAIENGYISTQNKEFVNVDNIGASVKIEDFLMDDINLSASLTFEFDDNIVQTIDFDKINNVEIRNFIVRDEENRIIYSDLDEEEFTKYCETYNLNYTYNQFNDSYMNNGVNMFVETKQDNFLRLIYNMSSENFPKSKKLYFTINSIQMIEIQDDKQIEYTINGLWQVEVNVPEEMYNREKEYYRVVSCSNPDFEVYAASVSDTGFELGIIISNIEKPEFDEEKMKMYISRNELYNSGIISMEEYEYVNNWFENWRIKSYPIYINKYNIEGNKYNKISYIENEQNNEYDVSEEITKVSKNYFLENNKFDFYQTFNMTNYDATDNIKAILYYYEEPVIIELEKTKK